jgi:allantoin racemase
MHIASILGESFSVVTVLDSLKPMFHALAKVYGVASNMTSIRVVS